MSYWPSRLAAENAGSNARLNRLNSTAPIRSRAAEEGNFQIPLWGIPLILVAPLRVPVQRLGRAWPRWP